MNGDNEETRPAIWAEGSQKPPFEPRAFARAALKIGRETVAGILARCGHSAEGIGGEMRAGRLRIPEDRLGRTGRYLPTAETTSRAVFGGAGILKRAAEVAQPNAKAYTEAPREVDGAYRDLFRDGGSVADASPARYAAEGESDQLASIRAVLNAPAEAAEAQKTPRIPDPVPAAASLSLSARLRQSLREGAARVIGYWMIAFVIPYGAIRAGLAHLNGEDLRKAHKPE